MRHLFIFLSILILTNPLLVFGGWESSVGKIPNLECRVMQTIHIESWNIGKGEFSVENYGENWSSKKYFIKDGDLSIFDDSRKTPYRYGGILYNEMGNYYKSGIEESGLYYLYFEENFEIGKFVHLDKYEVVVYRVSCKDFETLK